MASRRQKLYVGAVLGLAVLQVLFEDALVFLGATGHGGTAAASPYVMVAVPLAIFLLLAGLLFGATLFDPASYQ